MLDDEHNDAEDQKQEKLRKQLEHLEELQGSIKRSMERDEQRKKLYLPCLTEMTVRATFDYFPELNEHRIRLAGLIGKACRTFNHWYNSMESVFTQYITDPDKPPTGTISEKLLSDDEIIAETNVFMAENVILEENKAEVFRRCVARKKNDRHYAQFQSSLHAAVKSVTTRVFPEVQELDANGLRELDYVTWLFSYELKDAVFGIIGQYCVDPFGA